MPKNKNALAELSKELVDFGEYLHDEFKVGSRGLEKAQRIIAELGSVYEPSFPIESSDDVIDKCRAIAEEGEK